MRLTVYIDSDNLSGTIDLTLINQTMRQVERLQDQQGKYLLRSIIREAREALICQVLGWRDGNDHAVDGFIELEQEEWETIMDTLNGQYGGHYSVNSSTQSDRIWSELEGQYEDQGLEYGEVA